MTEFEFMRQARWLAACRGYKPSWAYVIFRQRYGKWPGKLLKEGEPMPASEEFLAWLSGHWTAKPENNPVG